MKRHFSATKPELQMVATTRKTCSLHLHIKAIGVNPDRRKAPEVHCSITSLQENVLHNCIMVETPKETQMSVAADTGRCHPRRR